MAGTTNYPTAIDDNTTLDETLEDGPAGDDVLAEHQNNQNAAIKALETKVGITSSADTASIDYKLATVIADLNTEEAALTTHISDTTTHGTTGNVVGTTDTQTLTNKTLTSPTINGGALGEVVLTDYSETLVTNATSGATETLDLESGNVFDITLSENCTFTFSNPPATGAGSFTLILRQDGTGSRTATWPASVDWAAATAPTLTTTASAVDILTFVTVDGGTTWYGFVAGQAMG